LPLCTGLACIAESLTRLLSRPRIPAMVSKAGIVLFLLLILIYNLRIKELFDDHLKQSKIEAYSKILHQEKNIFTGFRKQLPSNAVIFNLKGKSYIDCMFYSGFPAYNFLPSRDQYDELKRKGGYTMVVVNIQRKDCPGFISGDASVIFTEVKVPTFD
jgi:hypothetical protein